MLYEVVDYNNGYNGCIDPSLFYNKPKMYFTTDVEYGQTNDHVRNLQDALRLYGVFKGTSTGYYGNETAKAVLKFQEQEGISNPIARALYRGKYCYALTRNRLAAIFIG